MPESYTDAPLLTGRFDAALDMALEHHRRQLRKGTAVPYAAHLLGVASLVLEMGGTEDEAIGGLLHDMVEDRGGPAALALIEERFGPDVARIVHANSDTDEEPKPPWTQRKQAYLDSIAHKRPDELRVSLADKLHNARAILLDYRTHGEGLWDRFRRGEGASVRWYYRRLHEEFGAQRDRLGPLAAPALEELGRTVREIDRLAAPARGRLNHVALNVADRARSAAFYGEHFGLTERVIDDEHLLILGAPDGALLGLRTGEPAADTRPESNHFGFELDAQDEVRAARERLRAAGVPEIEWQDDGWIARVQVADPDGYRVELYAF